MNNDPDEIEVENGRYRRLRRESILEIFIANVILATAFIFIILAFVVR